MALTFDGIDAHDTGGIAEEAVRLLNLGISPFTVARMTKSSPACIGYLRAHEEYGVKSSVVLSHERLSFERATRGHREFMRLQKKIAKTLADIRKAVKHGNA